MNIIAFAGKFVILFFYQSRIQKIPHSFCKYLLLCHIADFLAVREIYISFYEIRKRGVVYEKYVF